MTRLCSELYVAVDLDTWEARPPVQPDQDEICEACGYRRLDPEYYAWLRYRMEVARKATRSGRLAGAQFEEWRARFSTVHAWALRRFGEPALLAAVTALNPRTYRPPRVAEAAPVREREQDPAPHLHPADGDWRFTHSVTPAAVAQVDAIRDQALSLGWTEAGLYQNRGRYRFPAGDHYGLVCFLGAGDRIGEVSAQSIEIVAPSGTRSRVYNRDVPQPWIRPIPETPGPTDSDTSARVPVSNK